MNIQFRQSPNYSTSTTPKIGYVFHGTLGAYKGAIETLCATVRKDANGNDIGRASAHFVIGRNEGEVTQLVQVKDVAWHAGIISNPNEKAKKVLPKKMDGTYENPNKYFVGIEFAWGYDVNGDGKITAIDKTITDWQFRCICDIMKSYQNDVKFTRDTILTHSDITSYKSDNLSDVCQRVADFFFPEEIVKVDVPKSKVEKVLAYLKTI